MLFFKLKCVKDTDLNVVLCVLICLAIKIIIKMFYYVYKMDILFNKLSFTEYSY